MNTIIIGCWYEMPKDYTGCVVHVRYPNVQFYRKNGQLHREDGPAIVDDDLNHCSYWLNDHRLKDRKSFIKELHRLGLITEQELFIELL